MDNDQIVSRMNSYLHTSANVLAEWLELQARDEKAAGWSDAGIKKMRDNFKSILRDGGLISGAGNDRQILRPLLTDETEKFLEDQGLTPIRKILSGER